MLRAITRISQGVKQCRTLLQRQRLSPGGGFYLRSGQGRTEILVRIVRFEIVPQSFSLLSKRKFQEVDEAVVANSI